MEKDTRNKIDNMVKNNKVFVFMKGTPSQPECGFSMRMTQVLESLGVDFKFFNVLDDDLIRQGIKEYSDWPTIPQLYINGKFVGGSDIVYQMFESGELKKLLE